jgi:hypothetical protein
MIFEVGEQEAPLFLGAPSYSLGNQKDINKQLRGSTAQGSISDVEWPRGRVTRSNQKDIEVAARQCNHIAGIYSGGGSPNCAAPVMHIS